MKLKPRVGMAATKHLYSDTHAAKIIEIISEKKIKVAYFKYPSWGEDRHVDVNNEPLSDMFEPEVWTQRKSGNWRQVGCPDKWGECWLSLGVACNYRCMED